MKELGPREPEREEELELDAYDTSFADLDGIWEDIYQEDESLPIIESPLKGKSLEQQITESNNEMVTLEKVKKFLRKNGLALAGVTIMIASFVTAVVSLVKSGVRYAKSTGNKIADIFKKISKKVGPILGPLFSLIGTAFGLLAKGAGWLANNLWVLLILIAYLIYDYVKWKSGKK